MALTATANVSTREVALSSLEMRACHILSKDPNQLNIFYAVHPKKPSNPIAIFSPFISDIVTGRNCKKCLCFCRTYNDTCQMYELVALELAQMKSLFPTSTHPEVELYGSKIRTCEKFDACTSESVKKRIVESFTKPDGAVRIVISTVAFAMGIDVPNLHTVIHWGAPSDIECYVQETGRGGRDGKATTAVLYCSKTEVTRDGHMQDSMRSYCLNTMLCRRQQLMAQFSEAGSVATPVYMHMCCDVCAKQCTCESCDVDAPLSKKEVQNFEQLSDTEDNTESPNVLSNDQRRELESKLLKLRMDLYSTDPSCALVGASILSGMTSKTIRLIVKNCLIIRTVKDVQSLGITSPEYATTVFKIVSEFCTIHNGNTYA